MVLTNSIEPKTLYNTGSLTEHVHSLNLCCITDPGSITTPGGSIPDLDAVILDQSRLFFLEMMGRVEYIQKVSILVDKSGLKTS